MSWLSSLSSAPKTLKHTKSNRHSSDPILQSFFGKLSKYSPVGEKTCHLQSRHGRGSYVTSECPVRTQACLVV